MSTTYAREFRRLVTFAFLAGIPLSGCTCHSTDSTEVGVLTRKIGLFGSAGVQPDVYPPGTTNMFPALITDWHTYDVSLQNLAMTRGGGGDRSGEDDLNFKTIDGNDIRVDVTVVWQVDPKSASHLLQAVGDSMDEVKEKLVRPACRSVVRDVLNSLTSEDFYVSDKRFAKAAQARDELAKVLEPEGIKVSQVILGEHHFHPEYEQVIRDKKLAEQNAERLKSMAHAAAEQSKSNLEKAKGTVSQQLAGIAGYLDQVKLRADAQLYSDQKRAEAIVAEKKAAAQGIQKSNEAMAGAGGKTMVKLKIAEALAGKRIYFVPSGSGAGNLQTLNLNNLIKSYAATTQAAAEKKQSTPSATQEEEE